MKKILENAIEKLSEEFLTLDLTFHKIDDDLKSFFPGADNENIMVCVFKGKEISEPFHRQDFFFINFAYKKNFNAISAKFNNLITIQENEIYIGQPYSGYALRGKSAEEIIIVGILIRKEYFFRQYLPTIYTDETLFNFFVEPQANKFSEEFIHLSFENNFAVKKIFEIMIVEYANRQDDTQKILKFLLQSLFVEIARSYKKINADKNFSKSLSAQIIEFICDNSDTATLKKIAEKFFISPELYFSTFAQGNRKNFYKNFAGKKN